jgi:hypothetical protein
MLRSMVSLVPQAQDHEYISDGIDAAEYWQLTCWDVRTRFESGRRRSMVAIKSSPKVTCDRRPCSVKAGLVNPDQTYTSVVHEITPLALIVVTHAIRASTYSWNRMTVEHLSGR